MHWSDLDEINLNWKIIKYYKLPIEIKVELFEKFLIIVCKEKISFPTQFTYAPTCLEMVFRIGNSSRCNICVDFDSCKHCSFNYYFDSEGCLPNKMLGVYYSVSYYITNNIEIIQYDEEYVYIA